MKEKQIEDLRKSAEIASKDFHRAEQCIQSNRYMEAAAMRSALESALKAYWVYRWDRYDPTETLHNKINYLANKKEFNAVIIKYMDMIRESGNQQLHEGEHFDKETSNELFDIFKKCIQAISDKIGIDLTKSTVAELKDKGECQMNKTVPQEKNVISKETFWFDFENILKENGEPFKIIHEKAGEQTFWACVNKNKAFTNNCVDISLVKRSNFLRIGLYIIDKDSPIGIIILSNKESINEQLSFQPNWEYGSRNPNTLRVTVKLPIDSKTSRELTEEALPIIMEFIGIAKNTAGIISLIIKIMVGAIYESHLFRYRRGCLFA